MAERRQSRTLVVLLIVCGGLVVLGSIGPWTRVGPLPESGLDDDGVITLLLGISLVVLAAIGLQSWSNRHAVAGLLLALSAFGVGAYNWVDIANTEERLFRPDVEPGWGVIITTIAALAGSAVAFRSIQGRTAPAAPQEPPQVF